MYKLWQAGVRGRLWSIDALYTKSVRQVRLRGNLSNLVTIDLGVAQGDTLPRILFKLYMNDMLAQYEAVCDGVPLPGVAGTGDKFVAQLFADDFAGVAATVEALQLGIDACKAWCDKWQKRCHGV